MKISMIFYLQIYIIKYILFIIILPLDANYFNIISSFNKHGFTNASLINIHIKKLIYHYRTYIIGHKPPLDTYIIWTWTIIVHMLFGHEPPLDTCYLDMNRHWTHIIWTWTTIRYILFRHGPLLNIPYYVEHEPWTVTRHGLLDSSYCWKFDT